MSQEIEDMHRWQQEIKKRLWEAEAGGFASEEIVNFGKLEYLWLSNIVIIYPTLSATVRRC